VLEVGAFSSLAVTLGLVLLRPRIGNVKVGPAIAALVGVALMVLIGAVHASDAETAADVLWRPLLAITSIMITTGAALRLGVIDRIAAASFPRARGSAGRLFVIVFALSALTAAVLNNDSAVLLLTPLVVTVVVALYPDRPRLVIPFAFAVFMAAGVAPLVTANPMNLIVADYAGLDFNEYAARMLPISVAGSLVTLLILRWIFRRELAAAPAAAPIPLLPGTWTSAQIQGLVLVFAVLLAYPVVSFFGGSVWLVAATGAVAGIVLCARHGAASPLELVRRSVAWEILVFLFGVFMLALGLQHAGIVEQLSDLYAESGNTVIGGASAVGSALINNHSMALTNLLAIRETPGAGEHQYLAALIGGDLGPRLLPMGSLAGLLWYTSLRALKVDVPLRQFMVVGLTVTVPALAVSLALLELLT
jgi:arsenical pump membrane protein